MSQICTKGIALVLISIIAFAAPRWASAQTDDARANDWFGRNRCERLLDGLSQTWRSFKTGATRLHEWAWSTGEDVIGKISKARSDFSNGRMGIAHQILEYNDMKWSDPLKLGIATKRAEVLILDIMLNVFGNEKARGRCNWRTLYNETRYYEDRREHLRHCQIDEKTPKYLAQAHDDRSIDALISRDFPTFKTDPSLRAVEVLAGPLYMFTEGKILPKAYARYTLLVLRNDIVVAEYPTLELNAFSADGVARPTPRGL